MWLIHCLIYSIDSNHSILQRIYFVTHKLSFSASLYDVCVYLCIGVFVVGAYSTFIWFSVAYFSMFFISFIFLIFFFVYFSPADIHLLVTVTVCLLSLSHHIVHTYIVDVLTSVWAPVETTFDTIFTNITVLSFVSVISILFWVLISIIIYKPVSFLFVYKIRKIKYF